MAKDPAALFFIDKWLIATKEMKADCRGWFLNLVLHQFDKKDLPNDIEELANLADVRVSEFPMFQQVFQQVLQHKFKENTRGRLENDFAKEIIQSRQLFKSKREEAGRMSAFVKYIRKNLCKDENVIFFIKNNVDLDGVDLHNQQVLEQVFKHMHQLYINVNENVIINKEDKGIEREKETIPATEPIVTTPEPVPGGPSIHKGNSVFVVPELKAIFQKHKPKYIFQNDKDFPALRKIAETIADQEKVSTMELAGIERIKETWEAIVQFILTDSLYKDFQISQVEKYFQAITNKFISSIDNPGAKNTGNKKASVVVNNFHASNEADNLIRQKHAAKQQ